MLTIAGDGDDVQLATLKQLCDDLGLRESVTFLGHQDREQVSNLFRSADIFLAPSDDENFGIASAEAVAAGLPIIGSRAVDALAEVEGEFLVKLESREPEAIAEAVRTIRGRVRSDLVREAHAASQRFGWPLVAERWLEIMNEQGTGR